MAITLLTFVAEIGGVALALQLVTSRQRPADRAVDRAPGLADPVAGASSARSRTCSGSSALHWWSSPWRCGSSARTGPRSPSRRSPSRSPGTRQWRTWAYYAVALFGAAMTPYEVFFFSSGGVEEQWTAKDIGTMRANVFIGFPLGGLLSLAIAGCAWLVLGPLWIEVDTLGQVALPVAEALGQDRARRRPGRLRRRHLRCRLRDRAVVGYSIAQYFGAQWGKYVRAAGAALFHLIVLLATLLAIAVLMTTVDPILVTEVSVVFSAVALPLTYFPILVVANDRDYMGERHQRPDREHPRHHLPRRHLRGRRRCHTPDDLDEDGPVSQRQEEVSEQLENRLTQKLDGALHLLDRQLLDCNGEMLGKADDIELLDTPEGLTITAVLTGPAALLDRLGGRLGATLTSRYRRLRISEPHRDRPWRIDFADVDRLDSAIHLRAPREGLVRRDREEHRLGRLTGMDVYVADGPEPARIGRVLDARFSPGPGGRLVLDSLIVGRGRPGSLLGYDRRRAQGPWLIRILIRRLHRHTVLAAAATSRFMWDRAEVNLDTRRQEHPATL